MTSPDFRQYIDLTVFDTTPQKLYDDSVTYAQTAMPEFDPRIGTIEDALLQSMSFVGAVLATGINRVPNGLMEGILRLVGFTRNEATFATGSVLITTSINTGVVIPAGTVVTYDVLDGDIVTSYPFATDTDLIIPSASDSGTVAVTATFAGKYPSLLSGQALTLVSQVQYVLTTALTADIAVGTDTETQTAYFNRASQYLASLNTTLATASHMTNYISSNYTSVPVFKVYDLMNSSNMLFATADAPGYITIAVCNTDGAALTNTVKNGLDADLEDKCVAGLVIDVVNMLNFGVTVAIAIDVLDGFTPATVQADVATVIESYLSYTGWDFSETINKNILIAKVSQVSGVKFVSSLSITTTKTAGSFVTGTSYTIATAGTTNFTLIGAANSTVGTVFTATGPGAGTGTATATFTTPEIVSSVATGNITILRAGLIPVGDAEVTVI
jgi:hypothetical protein